MSVPPDMIMQMLLAQQDPLGEQAGMPTMGPPGTPWGGLDPTKNTLGGGQQGGGQPGFGGQLGEAINSPLGVLGMNLLARSGPSLQPQGLGSALGQAGLATQANLSAQQKMALDRRLIESRIGLNKAAALKTGMPTAPESPIGKINPGLYTPASVEKFKQTGKYADLEWRPELRISEGPGGGRDIYDPRRGVVGEVESDPAARAAASQLELERSEAGRGRVRDSGGGFTPVPGTEAANKEEEDRRQREAGAGMKSIQAQTVAEDISRLNKQIAAGTVPFGRMAAVQEKMPTFAQSEGYRNANALIESVKGNVGVDSLLRIKQSGAGLGQVPQSQLDLLSRLLGELSLAQSEDQFVKTWNRTGKVYEEIWKTADDELMKIGAVPPEVFTPIESSSKPISEMSDEELQAIINGG